MTKSKRPTLPGIKTSPWYTRETVQTVTGAPTLVSAAVTLWSARRGSASIWVPALITLIGAFGTLLLKLLQARHKDRKQAATESPLDLSGCLTVLHATLIDAYRRSEGARPDGDARTTIHRVDGDALEQCVEYVGSEGGPAGRRFSTRSGVIGRAVLLGEPVLAVRKSADYEAFIREMVAEYNIPKDEARELSHTRWAWLAIPLFSSDGNVIGVVYIDSNDPKFFGIPCQELAVAACTGISSFVSVRYSG